jgi:hypothetical protein
MRKHRERREKFLSEAFRTRRFSESEPAGRRVAIRRFTVRTLIRDSGFEIPAKIHFEN